MTNCDFQEVLLQFKKRIGTSAISEATLIEFSTECIQNGRMQYLLKQDDKSLKKAFGYWKSKNVFNAEQLSKKISLASLSSDDCLSLAKVLIEKAVGQLKDTTARANALTERCAMIEDVIHK